jgi:nitrile hydratase beta subunit
MHGFGRVQRDPNEPVFHEHWERRLFGVQLAMLWQGFFNLDEARRATEQIDPGRYLTAPYYEHWLESLENLCVEKGLLSVEELGSEYARLAQEPDQPIGRRSDASLVERLLTVLSGGASTHKATGANPHFSPGDHVRARNMNPKGHTRLPRYVRGKRGVVHRVCGEFPLPDSNAHGLGEDPQFVYTVAFSGEELWSVDAERRQRVYIDLWENYLEPE